MAGRKTTPSRLPLSASPSGQHGSPHRGGKLTAGPTSRPAPTNSRPLLAATHAQTHELTPARERTETDLEREGGEVVVVRAEAKPAARRSALSPRALAGRLREVRRGEAGAVRCCSTHGRAPRRRRRKPTAGEGTPRRRGGGGICLAKGSTTRNGAALFALVVVVVLEFFSGMLFRCWLLDLGDLGECLVINLFYLSFFLVAGAG